MNSFQANICLICVTLCWSSEVIIYSCIPSDVIPFAITSITSLIGAALLFLSFFKRVRQEIRVSSGKLIKRCLFLSALNCAYNTMFIYGYSFFDVTTGAFTTALTVVTLPLILLCMRQRVNRRTWIPIILVLTGIILAIAGTINPSNLPGLIIMLIGCAIRSVFIVKLNSYAKEHDPVAISSFISLFVGGISFVMWLFMQPETFAAIPWTREVTASLFIYAYFIITFAQTLNIFAQKKASAVGATIIYSLEIAFTLVLGLVLPASIVEHTALTAMQILGAVLVVVGSMAEVISPLILKRFTGLRETFND